MSKSLALVNLRHGGRLKSRHVISYLSQPARLPVPTICSRREFKKTELVKRTVYAVVQARAGIACVVVAKSTVRAANLGLFTGEAVKSGTRLAICGGQPLINISLLDVPKDNLHHLRSIEGAKYWQVTCMGAMIWNIM